MRNAAVIFTCPKHLEAAKIAAQAAERWFDVWLAFDGKDGITSVAGQRVLVTTFARGGNLTSYEAPLGVLRVLDSVCPEGGRVVKIDSDTVIRDPSFLMQGDVCGFQHMAIPMAAYGCCYALSKAAVKAAIDEITTTEHRGCKCPIEDIVVTSCARSAPNCVANILPSARLAVWHDTLAPAPFGVVANFGNNRVNGDWCHPYVLEQMRKFASLGVD